MHELLPILSPLHIGTLTQDVPSLHRLHDSAVHLARSPTDMCNALAECFKYRETAIVSTSPKFRALVPPIALAP